MNRRNNRLIYALIAIVVINVFITGYLALTLHSVTNDVDQVQETQTKLTKLVTHSTNTSNQKTSQYNERTGYIPAHDEIANTGTLIRYTYQPTPGNEIYVSASTLPISVDTQDSFIDAKQAVEQSKYEPVATGATITVHKTKDWSNLHGRSGGLTFARMYASTDPDYTINDSVILTGQVEPNGRIETVNYIRQKAQAAEENGYDTIIVPKTYTETNVNGITIIQAGTLEKALTYSLDPVNETGN